MAVDKTLLTTLSDIFESTIAPLNIMQRFSSGIYRSVNVIEHGKALSTPGSNIELCNMDKNFIFRMEAK